MAITGSWTLFYDWNSDGSYSKTTMTINANGTWSSGEGYTGSWIQVAGMFVFNYSTGKTTYAANVASKSMTGVSTTFAGLTGSFYMLQAGVLALAANEKEEKAEKAQVKKDSSGQ
jgi:hypothetical protein